MKRLLSILVFIACLPLIAFADSLFDDGNKLYLQGDYGKALDSYNQFIQKEPKKFEGYYNAGNSLFRQEQYEDALQMYNKALELNPKDEDTKTNIAVTEDRIKNQPEDKKKENQEKKKKQDEQNKQDQKKNDQNKQGQKGQDKKDNKDGQGKDQKDQKGQEQQKGQQGQDKQGKGGNKEQGSQNKEQAAPQPQPPSGMSKDEVQALLNSMQNQEKKYRGYFGKQQQRPGGDMDMFQLLQRQMMDPNMTQQAPKGDSKEKDW